MSFPEGVSQNVNVKIELKLNGQLFQEHPKTK